MTVSAQNDPRRAGTIWVIHLHQSRPQPEPRLPVEFCEIGQGSMDELASTMSGTPGGDILRRLESGSRCYAARVNGNIASYGWVSFQEEYVGELNLRLRLMPGEAYIWDCFTLPAYRHQGLYSSLLAHILSALEAESVCRVWIGADAENIVSQRGIERAGFQHVADMVLVRVVAIRQVCLQEMPGVPEPVLAEVHRVFLGNRDAVWLKAMESMKSAAQPEGQPSGSSKTLSS